MYARNVLPLVAVMIGLTASSAWPQTLEMPEYTNQQRWERAALHVTLLFVTSLREEMGGKTPAEAGQAFAAVFGSGWSGVTTPAAMARAMHRNWHIWPQAEFVAEEAGDGTLTIRANRPWQVFFGETGTLYGASPADLDTMSRTFYGIIAQQQGMEFHQTEDEDGITIRIRHR